ncbi:MAG: NAD(P)-dependent oxidoreductase [Desulfovibrionaceae bacterium]|nr:NAD(P)-dependent oxidoreductase [Desulfovibrionaceae bacterium]
MPRAVLIGGSGFLGKAAAALLAGQGHELVALDIAPPAVPDLAFVQQDIRERLSFTFAPDDVVIHLAANQYHLKAPRRDREEFFRRTNTIGTGNVLARMEECGARKLIYFSTDMVYGYPRALPVPADHPRSPFGPYGRSKMEAEDLCAVYRQRGFAITIFRPRMIIGPGRLGILDKLFALIERNLPVPMIGSGKNCYQMVAVEDCARAILLAMEKGCPSGEYNLGSKNPPTVKELLRQLILAAGSRSLLIPTWGPAVKTVLGVTGFLGLELMYKEQYMIADRNYLLDISATEQALGWTPSLGDGDMIFAAFLSRKRSAAK